MANPPSRKAWHHPALLPHEDRIQAMLAGEDHRTVAAKLERISGLSLTDLRILHDGPLWSPAATIPSQATVLSQVMARDPLRATAWGTGVGAVGLIVVAAPTFGDVAWHSVTGLVWANVVFLAVGPTALAYLFYYRGLRSVGPGTATIMMFTVPVFGVFFSIVFLRESFTVVQLIGTLIMLGGAICAVVGKRSAGRHPEPAPAPVLAGQAEGE